jgi:hypothetical protein
MAFALAALVLSSVLLLLHTTSVTLAQPTPIPTTLSSMPSTSTFRRPPIVNPDPTPEQRTALFRVYDKLRCGADQCVRIGDVEAICGWDASAVCNNSVVVELFIYTTRGLEGTLGSELLSLSHLTGITVSGASLTGTISSYIGALSNLTFLDLRTNSFTGTIPTQLAQLSKLEYLDLSFNQLEGPVPEGFAQLTKLTFLDVSHNKLSGVVPPLSFIRQCYVAAKPDVRWAKDNNCFENCDNETLCCEDSIWPCGEAIDPPESDDNVALIVGVVLGILLAVAIVIVVVVVVRKSHTGANKADQIEVRINNSGYAAASEMADNGLPPSQQLQVSRKYSNPLDSADSPYNVMPGQSSLPSMDAGQQAYMQWGALSPMARPMPAPPAGGMQTFGDADTEYRNLHKTTGGQQSIPMPGSSGGLAQPYVPHAFIDQQHHQYNDDRFTNAQSPW